MNTLTGIIQRMFFRGVKASPSALWLKRARALGEYRAFELERKGGRLSCYTIEPIAGAAAAVPVAAGVVIFSHPITRKGKFFFSDSERAKAYLRRGYRVLAFDYNGFGESEVIDLFYWRDVVAVIDHARQAYPNLPMVLHGTSFGAFHMIRALDDLPPGASVVLENVNKSLISYWQRWPRTNLLVRVLAFLRVRAIREMDVQSVLRSFHRHDLHIGFIACENDQMTTLLEMRELYEQLASDNKSFTVFEGAGHLAAPQHNPDLYESVLFKGGIAHAE